MSGLCVSRIRRWVAFVSLAFFAISAACGAAAYDPQVEQFVQSAVALEKSGQGEEAEAAFLQALRKLDALPHSGDFQREEAELKTFYALMLDKHGKKFESREILKTYFPLTVFYFDNKYKNLKNIIWSSYPGKKCEESRNVYIDDVSKKFFYREKNQKEEYNFSKEYDLKYESFNKIRYGVSIYSRSYFYGDDKKIKNIIYAMDKDSSVFRYSDFSFDIWMEDGRVLTLYIQPHTMGAFGLGGGPNNQYARMSISTGKPLEMSVSPRGTLGTMRLPAETRALNSPIGGHMVKQLMAVPVRVAVPLLPKGKISRGGQFFDDREIVANITRLDPPKAAKFAAANQGQTEAAQTKWNRESLASEVLGTVVIDGEDFVVGSYEAEILRTATQASVMRQTARYAISTRTGRVGSARLMTVFHTVPGHGVRSCTEVVTSVRARPLGGSD